MADTFQQQRGRAAQNFMVTSQCTELQSTAYIEAQAKTGSRYSVVVTRLSGPFAAREGGRYLISVLAPWQAARAVGGMVEAGYVAEHLSPYGRYLDVGTLHGGDLQALTMAVQEGLRRVGA